MALSPEERVAKLEELKKTLAAYIGRERSSLDLERRLLQGYLNSQGISASSVYGASKDVLKSIALVSELLPSTDTT